MSTAGPEPCGRRQRAVAPVIAAEATAAGHRGRGDAAGQPAEATPPREAGGRQSQPLRRNQR
ncbi:hypothetical protein D7147_27870 [Micromonospora musae]|uniref:Uncharacterized protein n=1 Tax=Micromonospora musae TaxID=1894970 RepID=A0ABX9QWP3_9ACTN|nr:hypothetical protein D7147_27870 [Micromonospora musae]